MSEIDREIQRMLKHIQGKLGAGRTAGAGALLQRYETEAKRAMYGPGVVSAKVALIDHYRSELARGLRLMIDSQDVGDPIDGEDLGQVEDLSQVEDLGRVRTSAAGEDLGRARTSAAGEDRHQVEDGGIGFNPPPLPAIGADQVVGQLPELPAGDVVVGQLLELPAGDVGRLPELPAGDEIPFGKPPAPPREIQQRRRKGTK